MNKGFRIPAAALALTLGALPFGSIAENAPLPPAPEQRPQEQPLPPPPGPDAPKPRPDAPKPRPDAPKPRPLGPKPELRAVPRLIHRQAFPLPPMSEVDRAKFTEMNEVIRDAMEEFRRDGSEANRAKLRDAIGAMVEAKLKYDVEQAEKRLEFAKAQQEKKAALTERYLRRMTAEPAPALERPGKPGARHEVRRPDGKRPDPRREMRGPGEKRGEAMRPGAPAPAEAPNAEVRPDGAGKRGPREAGMRQGRPERRGPRMMERCFTEPERNELREARQKLMKAATGSAEAKAAVTGMNGVFKRALERVDKELAKAKENEQAKETAELEQAKRMLTRMAERTADPEKYLEAMKNRPAPRNREGRR